MSKVYKWILFSVNLVVLALLCIIPILLKNDFLKNNTYLGIYVFSKTLFGLFLLAGAILIITFKFARGMGLAIGISAAVCQIVPLFIRLILNNAYNKHITDNKPIIYSVILLLISLVTTIIPIIVVAATNRKMVTSDRKYEATEIPLQNENGENNE